MKYLAVRWLFQTLMLRGERHQSPTRQVEYLLAWCIICWSATTFVFGAVMTGPAYVYMIAIAPEKTWGMFGILFGMARVLALIVNGRWHRTPLLRFICAMAGLIWWLMVGGLFYLGVKNGAAPFPMLGAYPVLAYFEGRSCYRCGQDAKSQQSFSPASPRSPVAHAREVGNG